MAFERLLSPGRIGRMTVKNRIVMAPMATNFATADGAVTPRTVEYYRARALGGAGMVMVEGTLVDASAWKGNIRQLIADDDRFIPGLAALATAIKGAGARAVLQLAPNSNVPFSASPIVRRGVVQTREMTTSEMRHLMGTLVAAARRAKQAGFDGVEIHSAHGYLLSQFLSAAYNKRNDEYGGPLENRARFLLQIIGAVKEATGHDYPVWCRINGTEPGLENGVTPEQSQEVAHILEAGGVDAVHLSAFGYGLHTLAAFHYVPGVLLPAIEAVKRRVKIPVIAISRFDPELAEQALAEGKLDFVAMGRRLIADPELPNKLLQGRAADVVPCIACNICLDTWEQGQNMVCTVNPLCGQEGEVRVEKAAKPKRVLVVGGGPAGLTAARVAAERGHQVYLYEKEPRLGGLLNLALVPPHKERVKPLLDHLVKGVKERGVQVKLSTEVTAKTVADLKPEAVILAAGTTPRIPDIAGMEKGRTVVAEAVLGGAEVPGSTVAVLGGGLVAGEVAEFLAARSKKVTIIARAERLASKMERLLRRSLMDRLTAQGVTVITGVKDRVIGEGEVVVTDKDGNQQHIPADTVVLALGATPEQGLLSQLQGAAPQVLPVGDCVEARGFQEAIHEGYQAALKV